jgi:ribonuclease VapC
MIFVDASAIVAIIAREAGFDRLIDVLETKEPRFTSPIAIYEAALAVARIMAMPLPIARQRVDWLIVESEIDVEPLQEHHALKALDAFTRFGKGRHPAALNMGDCFAYASTAIGEASILFVGHDFSKTDLRAATSSH